MKNTPYPHGLNCALCALSFFRRRRGEIESRSRRALAGDGTTRNLNQAAQNRRLARSFIRQARAAGFRGSITAAVHFHHTAQPHP